MRNVLILALLSFGTIAAAQQTQGPTIVNGTLGVTGTVTVGTSSPTNTIIDPTAGITTGAITALRTSNPYIGHPELETYVSGNVEGVHVRDTFMLVPYDFSGDFGATAICGANFMACIGDDENQYSIQLEMINNENHGTFAEWRDSSGNSKFPNGIPRFRFQSNGDAYLGGNVAIWNSAGLSNTILTNGSLASPYWVGTNDCTSSTSNLQCTYSTGTASTLTQSSRRFHTPAVANGWYAFNYTVSSTIGGVPTGTITTSFASKPIPLILSPGTQTVYFQANGSPGDFVLSTTLTTGQSFILTSLWLKPIGSTGSSLFVAGPITSSDPMGTIVGLGLGTAAVLNVPAPGTDATANEVVMGNDSRLGSNPLVAPAGCPAGTFQYPCVVAQYDSPTQLCGNLGSTTLYAVPSDGAGTYEIKGSIVTVQAAAGPDTSMLPQIAVTWVDKDAGVDVGTYYLNSTFPNPGVGQTGHISSGYLGTITAEVAASNNILFSTANYANSGAIPLCVMLHVKAIYDGP